MKNVPKYDSHDHPFTCECGAILNYAGLVSAADKSGNRVKTEEVEVTPNQLALNVCAYCGKLYGSKQLDCGCWTMDELKPEVYKSLPQNIRDDATRAVALAKGLNIKRNTEIDMDWLVSMVESEDEKPAN